MIILASGRPASTGSMSVIADCNSLGNYHSVLGPKMIDIFL